LKAIDLSQAVAVITGAGSGIGRQLAIQLCRAGARLALNDSNAESLAETRRAVEELGGQAFVRAFDVACWQEMCEFAEAVQAEYGQADIVVNNAGVALGPMRLQDVSHADFQWIVNVNLWGVVNGTMAFLPMLRQRPAASLVNISSCYGLLAVPLQAPYCTTKFAVRGFTDSVRLELMDTDVCVTLVCPSQVRTNIIRNARHKNEVDKQDLIRKFDERMTRSTPDEMAQTIIGAILHKREHVVFGRDAKIISFVSRFLPRAVIKKVARRGLAKFENY
jgi:butyryl-CoA dehydrogenase